MKTIIKLTILFLTSLSLVAIWTFYINADRGIDVVKFYTQRSVTNIGMSDTNVIYPKTNGQIFLIVGLAIPSYYFIPSTEEYIQVKTKIETSLRTSSNFLPPPPMPEFPSRYSIKIQDAENCTLTAQGGNKYEGVSLTPWEYSTKQAPLVRVGITNTLMAESAFWNWIALNIAKRFAPRDTFAIAFMVEEEDLGFPLRLKFRDWKTVELPDERGRREISGSADSTSNSLSRVADIRAHVHEELLAYLLDNAQITHTVPSQTAKWHAALESITRLENNGKRSVTLQEAMKDDAIRPLSTFYLIVMGCVDKFLISRPKLSESPMVELLFFDRHGKQLKDTPEKLGISLFDVIMEDRIIARMNTKIISQLKVPLPWVREDAYFLLLRESILSATSQPDSQSLSILNDIHDLRSRVESEQGIWGQPQIDGLLSKISEKLSRQKTSNVSSAENPGEVQTLLHNMVGKWTFDMDFVAEYLRKGSEIQKVWCGYGWSEEEILKREKFIRDDAIKNGPLVVYHITHIAGDSLKLRIENNEKETKTKIIYQCRKQNSDMYVCKQSPTSDQPFVFRFDGKYIYMMLKMTPDMMNCEIKSTSPSEIWIAVLRLLKSK
jgi:hypothetical protein